MTPPPPTRCQVGCDHPFHDDPCAYLAKHDPSRDPNCPCEGAFQAEVRAGTFTIGNLLGD